MAANGEHATQRDIERLREDIDRMHEQNSRTLGSITVEIRALAERTRADRAAIHSRIEAEQHRITACELERAKMAGEGQGSASTSRRILTHAGLTVSVLGLAATWAALILSHAV